MWKQFEEIEIENNNKNFVGSRVLSRKPHFFVLCVPHEQHENFCSSEHVQSGYLGLVVAAVTMIAQSSLWSWNGR